MSPAIDDVEIHVTVVPAEPTVSVRVDPPTVHIVAAANVGPPGVPPGGTTGQVLAKLSDADGDVGWIDP